MRNLLKPVFAVCRVIILLLFVAASLQLTGCHNETGKEKNLITKYIHREKTRSFSFSVNTDSDVGVVSISPDELNGNFNQGIEYRKIKSVTLDTSDGMIPLEDALRNGIISEMEVFCCLRLDARNGFCEERYESRLGLTHFTFSYPECDIRIIYDTLETPDGQAHLISQMVLYHENLEQLSSYTSFYDEQTGKYLCREDFGVSFEVAEVSPMGITIQCLQAGGMQLGQLEAKAFFIQDNSGALDRLDDTTGAMPSHETPLKMDGKTDLVIDWREIYGELPAGNYQLSLLISDIYDASDVHPLMKNYSDSQFYEIEFSIR